MVTRPALRVQGGKFRLARWLLNYFPPHDRYVEPFGGAASVLMRKPRSESEVYNDVDSQLVNVFTVLRDPEWSRELHRRLLLTPYSRAEFEASFGEPRDDIDAARQTLVRSFMGHGNDAVTRRCRAGFRAKLVDSGVLPASDWSLYEEAIASFTERLRGVLIECTDALQLIPVMDSPRTLFYVDPSPVPENDDGIRDQSHGLRHAMSESDHHALAAVLHEVKGMVVLSGAPCDLYDQALYAHWASYSTSVKADADLRRVERVWLNPAAARGLKSGPRPGGQLFDGQDLA